MKNTKFYFLFAILFMASLIVNAQQDDNEPRYLIGSNDGKVHVSGFGQYTIGFSEFDGSLAVYNGGAGAVLLNQAVYFGAYGTGLSTAHRRDDLTIKTGDQTDTYTDLSTKFGHGGFWLGYIHKSHKPVHFGVSTKLGWGAVSLTENYSYGYDDSYNYYSIVNDNVFVINPQLEVELNMLRWFKINASAGYQFVTGIDQTYTNVDGNKEQYFGSNDFNKPVFNLSFVFGGFGGKR